MEPASTRKLPEPRSDEELPVQEPIKRKREVKREKPVERVTEIHHHHYYYSQVPMYNPYPEEYTMPQAQMAGVPQIFRTERATKEDRRMIGRLTAAERYQKVKRYWEKRH